MENLTAVLFAAVMLAGIVFIAKRFLKPVEGPLPDCCGGNGNKDLQV